MLSPEKEARLAAYREILLAQFCDYCISSSRRITPAETGHVGAEALAHRERARELLESAG